MMNEDNLEEHITLPALLDITERDSTCSWDAFDQISLLALVALRRAAKSFNDISDDRASDKKTLINHHMKQAERSIERMRHFGQGAEGWV